MSCNYKRKREEDVIRETKRKEGEMKINDVVTHIKRR